MIQCKIYESHAIPKIPCKNHEINQIQCQNNENHKKKIFNVRIMKIIKFLEFFPIITKINTILLFHARITKILKFLEFQSRITKIMEIKQYFMQE